jgi:hypothetical protein
MLIPDRLNARWIATLGDDEVVAAEAQLYTDFRKRDAAERSRAGARYVLLQGPATLVTAWHRWGLLNNEARARQLVLRHPPVE